MSVIILIIILGVLIFVHELGHFLVAKRAGIRVDEFSIGFPPRLWSKVRAGTRYTIGLIPFGGYVKIFGESAEGDALDPNRTDSFLNKSRLTQAAVLVAGVVFNVIFAWLLVSISLMAGFPSVVTESNRASIAESYVVVTSTFENSPAAKAGLEIGDQILQISARSELDGVENTIGAEDLTIASLQEVVASAEETVDIRVRRKSDELNFTILPELGIIDNNQRAIGISMERVGKLQLPFFSAIGRGLVMTGQMTGDIAVGLWNLIADAVRGRASLDNVAGPIGIIGIIDGAANFGFYYLLSFTAFISINLAVLNILPFPALDGGRLVVVLIESITRRSVRPAVANAINAIGFAILILLMIIITVNDVARLF